jgi:hypothetical protein
MSRDTYTYVVVFKLMPLGREFVKTLDAYSALEAAFITGHSFPLRVDVELVSVTLKPTHNPVAYHTRSKELGYSS